ncbi:MAG: tRNA (guanosine(46)-N7)-methyltransferase TrmB [Clostridiales bacterium]|nr:tRNA (guanosine(46)-N7)-methyltransferase TrmB [Clostridiales bacterium]
MRLRNVKGARETIASSKYVINKPEDLKGKWNKYFKNDNPIHIEIGMGKGQFIIELAQRNPNINYIGIEKFSSVLVRAIEKLDEREDEISNLLLIRFDAEYINNIFEEDEIERIYLNFSDPWPKARHAKRRLTSKEFLGRYDKFLTRSGEIIFKTDNKSLFDFSLEEIKETDWKLRNVTYDLHNSEFAKDNVLTEYEEKFSSMGKPIYRLVAYR